MKKLLFGLVLLMGCGDVPTEIQYEEEITEESVMDPELDDIQQRTDSILYVMEQKMEIHKKRVDSLQMMTRELKYNIYKKPFYSYRFY